MLAYIYYEKGKMKLANASEPKPNNNNIIINVNACAICGTDLRTYRYGSNKITPPRIIGHEVCGIIKHIGKNVIGFSVGERVQVAPAIGCGSCYFCKRGYTNLCDDLKTIGFQYDGCFAEYMEIPSSAIIQGHVNKVSKEISDEEAALAEPIACVLNAHQFINIRENDVVAIFGAGFIGCLNAEISMLKGSDKIIMIEPNRIRARVAKQLIPNIILIDPTEIDIVKEIKSLTEGRGVDVAITACSSGQAQMDAMAITSKLGRVSLFGGLSGKSKGFLDSNLIHYKEISVYGVHASNASQNKAALDLIKSGKIKIKKYINGNIYNLKEIEKAFNDLDNEKVLKAIIKPD